MNSSVFSNETIAKLYSCYNAEAAEDAVFRELFQSLADWLIVVDNKREFIETFVIRSDKAQILVVPNENKSHYPLVWDMSFWDFFETFVSCFFSVMSICSDDSLSEQMRKELLSFAGIYFMNCVIDFLERRFSAYAEISPLLNKYRSAEKTAFLYIHENLRAASIEVCRLGKEFVLIHELEHILYSFSPLVYKKDSSVFDEVLKFYHEVCLPLCNDNSEIDVTLLDNSVEYIRKNRGGKEYIELYNDYHAYFEMMLHYNENIKDISLPFSKNYQSYYFGVKLLKMFESCINYSTQIVEGALSTKFQTREQRIAKVGEISQKCQRKIYSRDYLAMELIGAGLYWYADRFPINKDEFIESLDTENFAFPYTNVLEPILNTFVIKLVTQIIMLD